MLPSIPANAFVDIIPGVIQAGGNPLSLNMLVVDNSGDTSVPIGTVMGFPSLAAVEDWYGPNTPQADIAAIYFAGYSIGTTLPSTIYFVQGNLTGALAGYLRGGLGITLAQVIAAGTGVLTLSIDGVSHVSESIALGAASSLTAAAALIQTGLQGGTPSTTATVTFDTLRQAFVITSSTTGASSAVLFPTTDAFATALQLTAATGALESSGAVEQTPSQVMIGVVAVQQNWATFMTVDEPTLTLKEAFAAWVQTTTDRFLYLAFDSDVTPTESDDATGSFGAIVAAADDDGVCPIWNPGTAPGTFPGDKAAFVGAVAASINFNAVNGSTSFRWRLQAGLVPDVTSEEVYDNLIANNYNAYVAIASNTQQFQNFQPGSVPGRWLSIQRYINQIYWNAVFQQDFLELLQLVPSIPYDQDGYTLIAESLNPSIVAMGAFGAWRDGVTLTGAQIIAINTQAGMNIASTLQTQGWYLQVTDPGPAARATGASPIIIFWYTDGGSIGSIVMNSIDVE